MYRQNIDIHKPARLLFTVLAVLMLSIAPLRLAAAEKPVVISCDWDFAPYEYINGATGEPDGYIIEVLESVLDNLKIPYVFKTNARRNNIIAFHNNEVDLIVDYRNRFSEPGSYATLTSLGYYRFCLAHLKSKPDLNTVDDLLGAGIIVFNNSNDSVAQAMLGSIADSLTVEYRSPREGLSGVNTGAFDYFFWGEEPTKWKLKEYNLPNVVTNSFSLYASEIHIVGHDKSLIEDIDDQYVRMLQKGEIGHISDRWFHPERVEAVTTPWALYITIGALLLTIVIAVISYLAQKRVRVALLRNEDTENMMHKALTMSNYTVVIRDLRHGRITNLHGKALPAEGISSDEFLSHVHPEDHLVLKGRSRDPKSLNGMATPFAIRWNRGTPEEPQWIKLAGYTFLEFDDHHNPTDLVITARNITEEEARKKKERELSLRYQKMFDSSLVATSFYDSKGMLVDLNDKMRELIDLNEKSERIYRTNSMFDLELMKTDFDPDSDEPFHCCQHLVMPEINYDKYIEVRVLTSRDENGRILYYIITARDVTGERKMYLELSRQDKALKDATETNTRYEREMRELLENSDMYTWRLNMSTKMISFSRSKNEVDFTRSLEEHIQSMFDDDRVAAAKLASRLTSLDGPFNIIHRFRFTPLSTRPTWQAISGTPVRDHEGNITEIFGLVRDVSGLMEAQERLKEETARAENSAMLKATFLANMTHEIRTPLNAIVGFSDLLHMVGSTEERKEFIHIIRNNCDMLMRLINDIFEASTMDVKPLEIKPEQVDFAREFAVVSQSLSQRVQEPGVEFIVDNPYESFVTILDMGRMQQVITNFLTNAVKYTHQGHIRVGYRYEDGGLYMYCEDTGAGIPKDKQKRVFDRFVKLNDFVQGTGLGLSICKSIAERSGGRIGLESEGEGTGSTFWIWVPCAKLAEKAKE